MAYLEWGTRLAMHNSQPDADVVERAPLPRWGWGEAPPFEGAHNPRPTKGELR
jgi:hemoglobin